MSKNSTSKQRLAVIFAVVFIDFLGLSFILPLYPEIAEKFGISATVITLLATSYALMQFLFSPVFGRLSDKIGRKQVLLLSSLGTAASFAFFGLSNAVWMLFASRILNGIFGSSIAAAQAYISDVTERHERTGGMGVVGAALGLGLVFGPALSAGLGRYGLAGPALGAAALSLLNFFLILFFLKESLPKTLRKKNVGKKIFDFRLSGFVEILRHPLMGSLVTFYFLAMLSLAIIQNIAVFFTEKRFHLTLQENGYLLGIIGLAMALTQGFLVGRLGRRIGESLTMITGSIFLAFGYFAIPLIENAALIMAGAGLVSVGTGLFIPSVNALVSKNASESEQGEVFGITQGLIGLALIIGPVLGGLMFDIFGSGSPFFAAGVLVFIGIIIFVKSFKKSKRLERTDFAHK